MSEMKGSQKRLLGGLLLVIIMLAGGYFVYHSVEHKSPAQPANSTTTTTTAAPAPPTAAQQPETPASTGSAPAEMKSTPTEAASSPQESPSSLAASSPANTAQASSEETSGSPASTPTSPTPSSEAPTTINQQQPAASSSASPETQPPTPASLPTEPTTAEVKVATTETHALDVDLELPPNFADRSEAELAAWRNFRQSFNKNYATPEEQLKRQAIFLANLRFIGGWNARKDSLYTLDVNQFADMTRDEINANFIGPQVAWQQVIEQLQLMVPPELNVLKENSNGEFQSVDWRNISSEVVEQGGCRESSVWAVLASLEAAVNNQIMSRDSNAAPLKLSEPQVLDCLANTNTLYKQNSPPVCAGFSSMVHILNLLQQRQINLLTRDNYAQLTANHPHPPAPEAPMCHSSPPGSEVNQLPRLNNYMLVNKNNIPEAIFKTPLVVALDASQSSFHFYRSGLYHDDNCSQETYNHHALLVGYSADSSGSNGAHLLLRNSFGLKWGEAGHMRLLYDELRNRCLPQKFAVYPNLQLPQTQAPGSAS